MSYELLQKAIEGLPAPFRASRYRLLQKGVHDSRETDVYVDEAGDFAFLCRRPEIDYGRYEPRVAALELGEYKKSLAGIRRRFEKVRDRFVGIRSVLEIGAGDASFLAQIRAECPGVTLASLEVDRNTRLDRDSLPGLDQFSSFDELHESGQRFECVCMFHVLEHVLEPEEFLRNATACLSAGGRLVIEVPSLRDPLLSLYDCEAYRRFYFQRQHPYVYSARSLSRLLDHVGYSIEEAIDHQRYGLENHLHWLAASEPGGSELARSVLGACESDYLADLERSGQTDSVIVVVHPAT